METYQAALWDHLAAYATQRLGVFDQGTYKGKQYPHILPSSPKFLNILESVRSEIQEYLSLNPSVKLHSLFHHLNSSQAFAFNLFYPFFSTRGAAARALSAALGINKDMDTWEFEHVQDSSEGTNADVMWRVPDGGRVFCEVKLSENAFGGAKSDDRHLAKYNELYMPRLQSIVARDYLDEKSFFKNYQLLRNASLLAKSDKDLLVILLPRANVPLHEPLEGLLAAVSPRVRERLKVTYIEDCLQTLWENATLSPKLRLFAESMTEKYVPDNSA
jgi:hypothetical protein